MRSNFFVSATGVVLILAFSFSSAKADDKSYAPISNPEPMTVPLDVRLGAKSPRGTAQEFHISPITVPLRYFSAKTQKALIAQYAEQKQFYATQKKYNLPPTEFRGMAETVFFQSGGVRRLKKKRDPHSFEDAPLKTINDDIPYLDTKEDYCFVRSTFEATGKSDGTSYVVYGILTPTTGEQHIGPFKLGSSGSPAENFSQGVEGISYPRQNDARSKVGNQKNERGRIFTIGCESTKTDTITVATLKNALGSIVNVVYPNDRERATTIDSDAGLSSETPSGQSGN